MMGEALRLIRVFHDRKLGDLAKDLDISPSYLSEIEHGKKQASLELIKKYAQIFETKPYVIMFFSEELDKESKRGTVQIKIREKLLKFLKAVDSAVNSKLPIKS